MDPAVALAERFNLLNDEWLRTGTVTAVGAGTVTVDLAGGQLVVPHLASYAPLVGHAVQVLVAPGVKLCLGAPGSYTGGSGGTGGPHTHQQAEVTSLTTALSGKSPTSHTHTPEAHGHAEADVTGLTTDLAGKAATVHGHVQSDVTNLATSLAGKSDTSHTHSPEVHVHAQSDVTSLSTALAAKSDTSHTHVGGGGGGGGTVGPVAALYQLVTQTLTNNTWTPITFTGEYFDTDNGHSVSTNTSRWTCPVAGYYQVSGLVYFATGATGIRSVVLAKNGSRIIGTTTRDQSTADAFGNACPTKTSVVQLNVGDYVEVHGLHTQGASIDTFVGATTGSSLDVAFLRPMPEVSGTATLAGVGSLTAAGVKEAVSAATLAGVGALSASGTVTTGGGPAAAPTLRACTGGEDSDNASPMMYTGFGFPAGTTAGDLIIMCLNVRVVAAGSAQVFTVGANRPGWTILHTSHNSGGTGAQPHTSCVLAKIYQAGDVFPGSASVAADSISWTSNGKYALSVAAITPAASSQIRIANDILSATPVIDTANATTHDTPDLNAGSLTGLDLVIAASRAQVDGATAVTATVPSGWTEPATADWSTAAGTGAAARQVQTIIGKKDGATGNQVAGNFTTNSNTSANLYHLHISAVTT